MTPSLVHFYKKGSQVKKNQKYNSVKIARALNMTYVSILTGLIYGVNGHVTCVSRIVAFKTKILI